MLNIAKKLTRVKGAIVLLVIYGL